MANKRQRKKAAKKAAYNTPKRKNLSYTDGQIKNKHGVVFTEEQRRMLNNAVERSAYFAKKQKGEVDVLRSDEENKVQNQLNMMGKESDFIISRQSKSLQRFKSMEEFNRYLDKQARIQSGEYLEDRTRLYKANYIKAVKNNLNDPGIAMKVRMMKPEEFRRLVEEKGDDMEIGFVYSANDAIVIRQRIRQLLGMKPVDDEDTYYNEE